MSFVWWLKRLGGSAVAALVVAALRLFVLPGAKARRKRLGYQVMNMGRQPEGLPEIDPETRLSSRVLRITGLNPGSFTLQGSNTYLVGTGSERILIDTGDGSANYVKLVKEVLAREKASIEHILISHGHWDHVGGIPRLRQAFPDVQIWKHLKHSKELDPCSLPYEEILENGTIVSVEGATLRAVLTPGHCSDHVCFILEEEASIFTGDCVLGNGTAVFDDLHQYVGSLRILLREFESSPAEQERRLYPGHGIMIHDGAQRIQEYIYHRQTRENQIVGCLEDSPMKVSDIVDKVYAEKKLNWILLRAAKNNVAQHLLKLKKEAKVKQQETIWSLIKTKSE